MSSRFIPRQNTFNKFKIPQVKPKLDKETTKMAKKAKSWRDYEFQELKNMVKRNIEILKVSDEAGCIKQDVNADINKDVDTTQSVTVSKQRPKQTPKKISK